MSSDWIEVLPEVKIYLDVLPDLLVGALVTEIRASGLRKREIVHRVGGFNVAAVDEAVSAIQPILPQTKFNLAILKRYRASDDPPSEAYAVHRDPPELRSIPLVICTLRGTADLTVFADSGHAVKFVCVPNMLVVLAPDLLHHVSPPTGPDGERDILFLGWRE